MQYITVAVVVDVGTSPTATLSGTGRSIPVIRVGGTGASFTIQFSPDNPTDTIRYLRELAAQAEQLADRLATPPPAPHDCDDWRDGQCSKCARITFRVTEVTTGETRDIPMPGRDA